MKVKCKDKSCADCICRHQIETNLENYSLLFLHTASSTHFLPVCIQFDNFNSIGIEEYNTKKDQKQNFGVA